MFFKRQSAFLALVCNYINDSTGLSNCTELSSDHRWARYEAETLCRGFMGTGGAGPEFCFLRIMNLRALSGGISGLFCIV